MGKNTRKKMRRRAALNENHSGSIDPSESECDQKNMRRRAALNENHSGSIDPSESVCEVPDVTNVGDEKNEIDHVYPNGNINYIMRGDEIDQIGWATCQYAHNKNTQYHSSYKCCLGSYNCPESCCKFKS